MIDIEYTRLPVPPLFENRLHSRSYFKLGGIAFIKEMAKRKKSKKVVLTPEEIAVQEKIANEILDEILSEPSETNK